MSRMRVIAVKLTEDPASTKVLYEKDGKSYIRDGDDGFKTGRLSKAPVTALLNKWGFRKVTNPPEFRDAEELVDGLEGFELSNDGSVSYSK